MAGCECNKWLRLKVYKYMPCGLIYQRGERVEEVQHIQFTPSEDPHANAAGVIYAKHLGGYFLTTGVALLNSNLNAFGEEFVRQSEIFFCPYCGSKLTEEAGDE